MKEPGELALRAWCAFYGIAPDPIMKDESSQWAEAWARVEAACMKAAYEDAAKVAEAYEPRCDTCPSGVAAAILAKIGGQSEQSR